MPNETRPRIQHDFVGERKGRMTRHTYHPFVHRHARNSHRFAYDSCRFSEFVDCALQYCMYIHLVRAKLTTALGDLTAVVLSCALREVNAGFKPVVCIMRQRSSRPYYVPWMGKNNRRFGGSDSLKTLTSMYTALSI